VPAAAPATLGIVSWILTLLGIVVLIVLHELGHFTAAKAVGMRVERFSLFFPPTLFRVRRGETEYAIGALPLGGYVKITGMNPEELKGSAPTAALEAVLPGAVDGPLGDGTREFELDPEITRRAYYNQAPWKRIVVILAGPGVNILIAFLLFWAILFSGNIEGAITLESLAPSVHTLRAPMVRSLEHGQPAEGTLKPGDSILTVGGARASEEETVKAVNAHRCAGAQVEGCRASTPVQLTVRRAGRDLTLSVYPRYSQKEKRMLIGFAFARPTAKTFGVVSAAGAAVSEMWHVTTQTITGFGHALTSSKARGEVSSIVGITQDAHETVVAGAGYALVFLAFISLILAVINLFPFLPLDGGHILWALAEKVRGRRISLMAMYRFSSVGIVLMLFLVINGVGNDIGRLGG
jgi:regulator of sigma E protease